MSQKRPRGEADQHAREHALAERTEAKARRLCWPGLPADLSIGVRLRIVSQLQTHCGDDDGCQ